MKHNMIFIRIRLSAVNIDVNTLAVIFLESPQISIF